MSLNLKRPGVIICFIVILVLSAFPVGAQDYRIKTSPEILIPLMDKDLFGLGGGGSFTLDGDFFGFLAPYAGLDVRYIAPAASEVESSLVLFSAGAGVGVFFFPVPRMKVGFSAGSGIYVGSFRSEENPLMTGNLFWRAGGEVGYRFSPGFTLSGGASYVDMMAKSSSFYRGLGMTLSADIGLKSRNAEGRVVLQSMETVPVYPVVSQDYKTADFGTVEIRNAESAEIRNVEIWFYAEGYSSGPMLCARVPYLPKGASASAPLYAAFSDKVMTITENIRLSGEVRVVYQLLGDSRSSNIETTFSIQHRNALTWEDPALLSTFISPNDPSVLEASKYIAGNVRAITRPELDVNLQYALGLFEGLRLSGIAYSPDPQTPYASFRNSLDKVDYVQYPHQTLAYRGGDSDDLAVLYAAALESVGVPAAIIPLKDEVIVAFMLSSSTAAARAMFSNGEDFVYLDEETWVPVKVSLVREGFLQAWSEGAKIFNSTPQSADLFFKLSDTWLRFPPAGVPGISSVVQKPAEDQIRTAFDSLIDLVVSREIIPRVQRLRASFGPEGGSGRQLNALGVLYARYGLYTEALAEFQAASSKGETRAHINIGNVAFLLRDFETAVAWYQRAAEEMPDEVAPIIGLARAYYELDQYDEADWYFRKAAEIRPELAVRYGYLSARLVGSDARASAAMDRVGDMMWDD